MRKDRTTEFIRKTIEKLNIALDQLQDSNEDLVDFLQKHIQEAEYLLEILTGEALNGNDSIESLLEEYDMTDMSLDDIRNMAARYSYTYPDCQVRAILHVIGHSGLVLEPPKGWKIVPVRLTQAMRNAAHEASDADEGMGDFFDSVYEAQLIASPKLGDLVEHQSAQKMARMVGASTEFVERNGMIGPDETFTFTEEQLNAFVDAVVGLERKQG
jgi:hypothetical protein